MANTPGRSFICCPLCTYVHIHYTIKPETLMSGNFDEFGEFGSNRQTLTFQSKATKQNKRLQIIYYL